MRVLLVRHGECEDNVAEADRERQLSGHEFNAFLAGAHDSPLTVRGRRQAEQVAESLRAEGVERVYTSPLPRAYETAVVLAARLGLPAPIVLDDLRELTPLALKRLAPARVLPLRSRLWPAYALMLLWPTSPDWLPRCVMRLRHAWGAITAEQRVPAVAVVGHGWATMVLVRWLQATRGWRVTAINVSNCGVSVVEDAHP